MLKGGSCLEVEHSIINIMVPVVGKILAMMV